MQKRITKDLLIYLPGKALPALAAFITLPIYTRLFSPQEFGDFVLATAASEFLLLGTISGFGQAAVRFFSAYKQRDALPNFFAAIFSSVGLVTLLVTAMGAGILVLFRTLIPTSLYPLLWYTLILFVVSAWFQTLTDVLRSQEQSRWYSISWVSQHYGGIAIGLILVLGLKMGIGGLIWGQTLGLMLAIIPLVWLTTRSVPIRTTHLNQSDIKQLWQFAWPVTIGNIAFWSLSLADRYIVRMFHGSHEVGLYSVSNKISSRTTLLLVGLFFLAPAPTISRLWEEKGRRASEEALTTYTRIFFLVVIPAVFGLAVVAVPLVRLLADEAYFNGYTAIWLVALASMGLGLSDLGSIGCLVANQTRRIARNQCIAAASGLVLNFALVPAFGFMGAATSAAVAFFLLAVLQAISSARILTWHWPIKSLWKVGIASLLMAGSVLLIQENLPNANVPWQVVNLLLSILVGALTYGLVLWALGEISPRDLLKFLQPDRQSVESHSPTIDSIQSTPGSEGSGR